MRMDEQAFQSLDDLRQRLPSKYYVGQEHVMLTVDVEKTNDVAIVRCIGRLVRGAGVSTLRNAVVSENDTRMIVLDLSEVEMMDAGGLSALVSLHHWTRSRGIRLKLVNPAPLVLDLLTRTHLDCVFDISTFADALLVLGGCEGARTERVMAEAASLSR
jgi:anti-anti-sigma factor